MISTVEIKDGILLALDSIKSNKFRAGLTILGVLIGVAAVIGMASIIAGLDKMVMSEIESMGSNVLYVTKFPPDVDYDKLTEEERNRKPIDFEAVQAIQEFCPSVTAVAPRNYYTMPGGNIVKYKNNQANRPGLFGTLPDYVKVENRNVERGRFFNDFDMERRAMVTVIGSDVAKALFPREDPLEKSIRVNSRLFRVIGVMEEKPPFLGESDNNFVILPYSTYEKLIPWEKELFLQASTKSPQDMEQAIDEITATLRRIRGVPYNKPDNFAIWTQENIKDIVNNITQYIYIAMIVISSVGLMVGGVGVMNIMLVSVTERTREIGIRKAIGAKRMNILIQFLTEAMTLSGSGGVLGIFAGILLAFLAKLIFSMPFTVSIIWMFIGFSVSVMVGLTAGLYPAYKAARVDPIISLRYE
jgi:putative ABC transport system permease protein